MSDLKPCPFCGDDAEWVDIHDDEYGNTGGSVIECVSCGASTHVEFGFKENLTSAWNRRAASRELVPAMAARIEELETKLAAHDAEVYRRGQEDMWEQVIDRLHMADGTLIGRRIISAIRAIPIKEKDDE